MFLRKWTARFCCRREDTGHSINLSERRDRGPRGEFQVLESEAESEKAEIIQLVEQSHQPAMKTLDMLGILHATVLSLARALS